MSICLCTLVLNEIEWLDKLYQQHRDWPELARWIFVEACDVAYREVNPEKVSPAGLSVDGTTEYLQDLAVSDPRVTYIAHGFSQNADPALGKCAARQRYLDVAEEVRPEFLMVLDGDEFYPYSAQKGILDAMRAEPGASAYCFRFRHPWRPPRNAHRPLFEQEVVGGFWSMPHCHWWRWSPGMRYTGNHNSPVDAEGRLLNATMHPYHKEPGTPECIHMAFSSSLTSRRAKHAYYEARGEGRTDKRAWYVASRTAWQVWRPGARLPKGARIVPYQGEIPEVFRER